ncbi:unconventional myosin-Ia-like isoform X2 [Watersipora subatra]|uniref:unconventional myosin-Ia-like isoform X2 n=1 Tax=Watersipora subatra TaxID=2589382 RepID=UPI00355C51DC
MAGSRLSQHWRNAGETDNLAELSKLDEDIILEELKARYKKNHIYTYVGDILISINPFKELPIYRKQISHRYRSGKDLKDSPHIYAIAGHVYRCMLGEGDISSQTDQCIVISGESGAGKTESTKLVVKQIIELCNGNTQLEQQILQVNPLLEAFGNAKTVINFNSSRFGKYIQILFNNGKVIGAKISEYLLEKSRVVHQNGGDANFHIFSYMLNGCTPEQKKLYELKKQKDYRYTKGGKSTEQNLSGKFEELQNSMDLVGFSEQEQEDLLFILSGVLAIGNINFAARVDSDGVGVTYPDDLELAAQLFGIQDEELEGCLTHVTNSARGERIQRNFNKHQAEDARDAVAKVIYGRLFSWIVNKINQRLSPPQRSAQQKEIGILDIFGFENFALNSFEQACINLANEHLQFFFNEHIFCLEQEEYKSEGIKWAHISYCDNQPLLDLYLKRPIGILALLDEESHFPQATDSTLVHKLNSNLKGYSCYKSHKSVGMPCFTIKHYAGEVTYNVTSWLEKNRDTVPPTLISILKHSSNSLLRTIFQGTITRTGTLALQNRTRKSIHSPDIVRQELTKKPAIPTNTKKFTVGTQFKNSLQELIKHMSQAEPHFVRCLKPNNSQEADKFDDNYVLSQLSYTGMLQTVQIRRDGYAFRPLISDFVGTYKMLLFNGDVPIDGETCKQILRRAELTDWHIGQTKVFLKYEHGERLADQLLAMSKAVTVLQAVARGFLARCYVRKRKKVSQQQKQYVEAFIQSISSHCEKFLGEQRELKQQEEEQRAEASRREKREQARRSAIEASERAAAEKAAAERAAAERAAAERAAAERAAAERAAERSAAEKQATSDRLTTTKVAEENEANIALRPTPARRPNRPPKPSRLSAHADASSGLTANQEKRVSKPSEFPAPLIPELPPQLPEPPTSPTSPTRYPPARTASISRKIYSESRKKSFAAKFSKFGEGLTDEDEVLEDDFSAARQVDGQTNSYGPAGSKQASIEWFRASQLAKVWDSGNRAPYEWFHGTIPRGKAEKILSIKDIGAFMIRLSERRLGYVLSFRAENRCRNYMVELTPSNKYVVVGESKAHKTLLDLVTYYQKNALSNWNGLLTVACGQADPSQPDYLELLPTPNIDSAHYLKPQASNGQPSAPPPLPRKLNPKVKEPTRYINYKE